MRHRTGLRQAIRSTKVPESRRSTPPRRESSESGTEPRPDGNPARETSCSGPSISPSPPRPCSNARAGRARFVAGRCSSPRARSGSHPFPRAVRREAGRPEPIVVGITGAPPGTQRRPQGGAASVQHLFPRRVAGGPGRWQPRPHDDDQRCRHPLAPVRKGAASPSPVRFAVFRECRRTWHALARREGDPRQEWRGSGIADTPPITKTRAAVQVALTALLVPACLWALFGPREIERAGARGGKRPARRHCRLLAQGLTAVPPSMPGCSAKFARPGASRRSRG